MAAKRTEARHPAAEGLQDQAPAEIMARFHAAQTVAVEVVRPAFASLAAAAEAGATAIQRGRRLVYVGAGSSGLMALSDCLELCGTFGIPPDRTPMLFAGGTRALLHMTGAVEDDPELAETDVSLLDPMPGDVLLCVSASGTTPYTLHIARKARERGATIVGIANVGDSALLALADIPVLLDTGPELIAGSTRLGAGTAQKIALNMISVLIGVRLGHVHDGYMVNVIADNAKLVGRARRIVQALTGADSAQAEYALRMANGSVKPATLIAAGATPEKARAALEAHDGHLGPALAALKG
ncbi:MAG: N-acetylmuramic acid 6-phosphate etherase [Cereibacter sphaeroides]|uniref:N-acetylmuramic acid 6-phosphate etherase n=1 Tax=Cereibacter sphaeroides TaxID=1063 RepID=A0A2W5S9I1_CERSP|nr:MAG: N-acetylmuramic acid 6-phosphate etherase [Cereibacter sphaeroides]